MDPKTNGKGRKRKTRLERTNALLHDFRIGAGYVTRAVQSVERK